MSDPTGNPTLLAVFAHPDDEAFGTGGTLTKYAALGCDVYLVTATRGEAGQIARPELATEENLAEVRERELRCACEVYGIRPPILLGYVDGQLTIVHQGQAVRKLVRIIGELKPQVLLTFGPDGIYGHYDHLAVHRWASIAVDMAADPDCFPDLLEAQREPHRVSKVYFRAMAQDQLDARAHNGVPPAVMMDGVPFRFVGRSRDEITTVIDISAHATSKLRGIQCHRTQLSRDNPYAGAPETVLEMPLFLQETYVLSQSTVGWPTGVETDLLARLRLS